MNSLIPKTSYTYAGVRHNIYHGGPGDGLPRHEHAYPHATVCIAGRLTVRKEGKEVDVTPEFGPIVLVSNEWHEIECMEPGSIFENTFVEGQY